MADRVDDQLERLGLGLQVRREAALVADGGRQAALLEQRLERLIGLRRRAEGSRKLGIPTGAIMNS